MARGPDELSDEELDLLGEFRTPEERQEVEDAQKAAAEKLELRRLFLIRQMENPTFREWLMEQLSALGTFEHRFGGGPTGFPDPMATQYSMGMKAAGWHLWEQFDNIAPELASLMRREASGTVLPPSPSRSGAGPRRNASGQAARSAGPARPGAAR